MLSVSTDPELKRQKLDYEEDDCTTCGVSNNHFDQNYSICSTIKKENNEYLILEHRLQMLRNKEAQISEVDKKNTFNNACVNLVLGYFNRYMNGLSETLGGEYDNEIDDGKKTWYAQRIGKGGFGTVLKLIQRNDRHETVAIRAIKVIPNSTLGLSEAMKASRLNHPNVVKVYNVLLIRYVCCIEMEYIECGSLQDLIRNQSLHSKLTTQIIEKMLFQCCEVLSLMRQNEMVHSDIKSSNIMIRNYENFDIAIADFGLTLQNETIVKQARGGTITYLAPELKNSTEFKPTFQSDIYALGTTFIRLLNSVKLELSKDYSTNMREIVLEALKNGDALKYADESLKKDREIVLEAVKRKIWTLSYADESFKKDREIILEAVKQNAHLLYYADEILRKDREFVLEAVKQDGNALEYADESFRKDREFVLEAVKQDGNALEYADESFRKDREIILEAVKQNAHLLYYADEILRKDREFVLEVAKRNCYAFEYADESLRKDREFMLKAIKQHGCALQYADESLRKDREIVLEAVKENGDALKYADESLRIDREIVLETLKQCNWGSGNIDSLKEDREIILEAVHNNNSYFLDGSSDFFFGNPKTQTKTRVEANFR